MKLYKITKADCTTSMPSIKWGENITHTKNKVKVVHDIEQVLKAYTNIHLAFILEHHSESALLWEASGEVVYKDCGIVGCFELRTDKQIQYPEWVDSDKDISVRVAFAILCAESVLGIYNKRRPYCNIAKDAIRASYALLKDTSEAAVAKAMNACQSARRAEAAIVSSISSPFDKDADYGSAFVLGAASAATAAALFAVPPVNHDVYYCVRESWKKSSQVAAIDRISVIDYDYLADRAVEIVA